MKAHQVVLASRPSGRIPEPDNFRLESLEIASLRSGEVLVRNEFFSVDPYMEERLHVNSDYMTSFKIGAPLDGRCVGGVIESRHPKYKHGDRVVGFRGFRDYWVSTPEELTPVNTPKAIPLTAHLGPLGNTGFTAFIGLTRVGGLKEGDNKKVYVSAAAGAVGSVACQIAKLFGCHVVGSTGTDAKVAWLRDKAGVDAFNYRTVGGLQKRLTYAFPSGINVYFDNVGGSHLDAALGNMVHGGCVALCGEMETGHTFKNMGAVVNRRLRLQGFIAHDHASEAWPEFESTMTQWLLDATVAWEATIYEGMDKTAAAFAGLFNGENLGKSVVKVA